MRVRKEEEVRNRLCESKFRVAQKRSRWFWSYINGQTKLAEPVRGSVCIILPFLPSRLAVGQKSR